MPVSAASIITRTREEIEDDIDDARLSVELAEEELERAEDVLARLEAELATVPPDDLDIAELERWAARRDSRQLSMFK